MAINFKKGSREGTDIFWKAYKPHLSAIPKGKKLIVISILGNQPIHTKLKLRPQMEAKLKNKT